LIESLVRWDENKQSLIKSFEENAENILSIKNQATKKFLVDFMKKNVDYFYDKTYFYEIIKVYITDEHSGVSNKAFDLLFTLINNEKFNEYLISNNIFLELIKYLDNLKENNSILFIREIEILIKYLSMKKNDDLAEYLKLNCNNFFKLDLLTQLTFLDILEKEIQSSNLADLILKEINFFQNLNEGTDISNELLRKCMYTISKLYADGLITNSKIIKNLLVVSFQYFDDNSNDFHYITSIISNLSKNKQIFLFLLDEENNSQFDFLGRVVDIIVDSYNKYDPNIKIGNLDIIKAMVNFSLPSISQEQFLKKFVDKLYFYEYNKNPQNENDANKFFIEKLYKDFKTHDFEEYEEHFLEVILSNIYFINIFRCNFL
jgi:hypothetical protein